MLNKAATIGGAGSTFAAPLQNAAQAAFMARAQNATINGYQAVGSGTGESDIFKKVVDWGGTDVPMSQTDIYQKEPSGYNIRASAFLEVPIALGGVAITYNLAGLSAKTPLILTASVLANIYEGHITNWNSAAIQALNPKVKLPATKIVVAARADSSGTTYIFTNFLRSAAPKVWATQPSKAVLTLPTGGVAGSGNAGVAADIENTPNAIGYVEYSYVLLNPSLLKGVAAIVNKAGKALTPSLAGIARGSGCQGGHHILELLDRLAAGRNGISDRRIHLGHRLEGQPDERRPRNPARQVPRLAVALGRSQRHDRRSRRRSAPGLCSPSGQHPGAGARHAAQGHGITRPGATWHQRRLSGTVANQHLWRMCRLGHL